MKSNRQSSLPSTLQECTSIRDVLRYCTFNTVVIFDIDNTLLRPTHADDLGSDQWFRKTLERAFLKFSRPRRAVSDIVTLNNQIQRQIEVKPVEACTSKIVKVLRDLNLTAIAVSARRYDVAAVTQKQLKDVSVEFTANHDESFRFQVEGREVSYIGGVLYCDGANKGLCLSEFLKRRRVNCCEVVMLDDVKENLINVRDVMQSKGFGFHGLRYNKLDERVAQFDLKRANAKLSKFSMLFSRSVMNIVKDLDLEELNDPEVQASLADLHESGKHNKSALF